MPYSPVTVHREPLVLPTYEPLPPDKNPMFLERRVYQGSSGKVYPLPFYNRISDEKKPKAWDAVRIENEFIEVVILPELGGRIHIGRDKTNGYDFFYNQHVIKPALVGLAGPWASGGVEFNWPQHHRPATFMPVDVAIEEHEDGSKTVWLSDHDPMSRMKGMHGVCLHSGQARIELKMRAYNRTPFAQTFLWWANVATHVHEGYKSFFPPDVNYVADHAKRAMSRFPLCDGSYYGVDYARRAQNGVPPREVPAEFIPPHCRTEGQSTDIPPYEPNDLSWYANIPVPTSYMCMGSKQDFSGGFDYKKHAGLIQIADHHIAPGKKQWTWGNHDFGYAWDRNLTESDGPYVELMLGVYTDNQPDFSFLKAGETKDWSVFWYPIQEIGPAQYANERAAISLTQSGAKTRIGVAVSEVVEKATIELRRGSAVNSRWTQLLRPDRPFVQTVADRGELNGLEVVVLDANGREIASYRAVERIESDVPPAAAEPPEARAVPSTDELYTIGLHLAQYRHATRSPLDYWKEALERDPGDSRCNNAVGLWHLRRGEPAEAENYFRRAIERLTSRNPNPKDGEACYNLGLALRYQGRDDEAYDSFYKAIWDQAWQAAGYHAIAEIDCRRRRWIRAADHLRRALRVNQENLRARDLLAVVLQQLDQKNEAEKLIRETLAMDPLDWWARYLSGDTLACDNQTRIDLAIDCARAGLYDSACQFLKVQREELYTGATLLALYHLAYVKTLMGDAGAAAEILKSAASCSTDYCFPARLEDEIALRAAIEANEREANAHYLLGNLLYDKRRYEEAIRSWERAVSLSSGNSIAWRNLGIAYFNVLSDVPRARAAYDKAFAANPVDARLLFEKDQLWKRVGVGPEERLGFLDKHLDLVLQRDDACIEICALYNQLGRSENALKLLRTRKFQPWEGGEGQALGQFTRTNLLLARDSLRKGDAQRALLLLRSAISPPQSLGEARHLLANQSDIAFWLGETYARLNDSQNAQNCWREAADAKGDFQEMSVRAFSEMTYYSALAMRRLGRVEEARALFQELGRYAARLRSTPAKIDYFATSLPTMLLFNDDLNIRQETTAIFLEAQSAIGLGEIEKARRLLAEVLSRDPNHAAAADLFEEANASAEAVLKPAS
ncbi:MAG TPA: DUF5107 domain-containing protein [Opitutaceae bacterium]|nr:DUF5107 domain-containing protein [Opitutaceae bacterium]